MKYLYLFFVIWFSVIFVTTAFGSLEPTAFQQSILALIAIIHFMTMFDRERGNNIK